MKNDPKINRVLWQIQALLEEELIFAAPELGEYYHELVASLNALASARVSGDSRAGCVFQHLKRLADLEATRMDELYRSFFIVKGLLTYRF
jgi:hypothetical protein